MHSPQPSKPSSAPTTHDNEGLLTDYFIVAQRTFWDDDGDQCEAVYLAVRDGSMGLSQQLGLLEFASTRIRKAIAED